MRAAATRHNPTSPMNLRRIDLNLLVLLDVVLEEQHITRAAARLALTQSAVSNALARLRELFDDQLLVRTPEGMRLTPFAQELRERVRAFVGSARRVFDTPTAFDPGQARQVVRIGMRDFAGLLLLPALTARLARKAPKLELVVLAIVGGDESQAELEAGRLDLAITVFPRLAAHLHRVPLLEDRVVCLMRAAHPAASGRMTAAKLARYPGVLISGRGQPAAVSEQVLAARGLPRHVLVSVPHYLVVPAMLRKSDAIALVPQRLAEQMGTGLVSRPVPIELPPLILELAWHPRLDEDPLHAWLRAQVAAITRPGR
jgi:DNA-binding transcriptional LysR family regulator